MDFPTCALPCLISAVSNSTCALTDMACVCRTPEIAAQLEPCVLGDCSIKESLTFKNTTYTMCDYPSADESKPFIITAIVGLIVSTIAVVLRLTNRGLDRRIGIDDYILIFTLLLAASTLGVGTELCKNGLGKDIWTIPFGNITQIFKLFFIDQVIYCACVATIKISMLCLFLQIFPNRGARITAYVGLAVVTVWVIAAILILLFSCQPLSHYWDQWDGEHTGKCLDQNKLLLGHSIVNIGLDVIVIIIPMPTLTKLRMPLEKKLGVCAMFAVGAIVTIISIIRLIKSVGYGNSTNPTRDFSLVANLSTVEFEVGIILACMPAMRSLVIRIYNARLKPHLTALSNRLSLSLSGSTQVGSQSTSKNRSDNGSRWRRDSRSHNLSVSISGTRSQIKDEEADKATGPFIRLDDIGTVPEEYDNSAARNGGTWYSD